MDHKKRKRLGTNRASIKNALKKKRKGEKIFGLNQKRFDEDFEKCE